MKADLLDGELLRALDSSSSASLHIFDNILLQIHQVDENVIKFII